jgi:hypothetical protein
VFQALVLPPTSGIDDTSQTRRFPQELALFQNYPNPFNPETVVRYQLPVTSEVRLAVYDVLGREVAVLVNRKMGAGVHEVSFDASGFPSGVYYCRLTGGSRSQIINMVLLR